MSESQRYLVLGTAGHIDHGKTTLIKALTGTDCDRLTEEKDRGITIDIGFAHLELPAPEPGAPELRLGIVDVPGHRRFIRNMVAGAAGLDLILLVIAADDSVMPQTVEHLHIARLLGVQAGLVALNKADLVDPELLELVRDEVAELMQGTFMEGCPVVAVSAVTGMGLDELREALRLTAGRVPPRRFGERFRMPVDRSFSIKGAGTVVTGTVWAGHVRVDDEVELLPAGKRLRVRGIQNHGVAARAAAPGQRTAINLAGVDKTAIQRGDILAEPGSIVPTDMFDAKVELLPGRFAPLRRGSEALVHIGTAEVSGKLQPLDAEEAGPGSTSIMQLRLGGPVAIAPGDRFILRHSSGEFTLGGGQVLDAHPHPHRRQRTEAALRLSALSGAGLFAALLHEINKAQFGLERGLAAQLLNTSADAIGQACTGTEAAAHGLQVHREGKQLLLTLPANRARIEALALKVLALHHAAHPLLRLGLGLHELSRSVHSHGAAVPTELLQACMQDALAAGRVRLEDGTYVVPGHAVQLTERDQRACAEILKRIGTDFQPPQPDEFAAEAHLDRSRLKLLLEHLVESGALVLAPGGVYFAQAAAEAARRELERFLAGEPGITVSEFSQLVNSTRKYSIPLLQYFEQNGMLVRDGDLRKLAQR